MNVVMYIHYIVHPQYGAIEEMNVCDNLGDHLVGNVYIKVSVMMYLHMYVCVRILCSRNFEEEIFEVVSHRNILQIKFQGSAVSMHVELIFEARVKFIKNYKSSKVCWP